MNESTTNDLDQILEKLREPFSSKAVQWRIVATTKDGSKGQFFPYIDARDIQKRLDEVVGFENWKTEYKEIVLHRGGFICSLSLKINGEWVTKQDGSGASSDKNAELAVKGSLTDAFKRAAVVWGVGRYLYDVPSPYIPIDQYKQPMQKLRLPVWALPKDEQDGLPLDNEPVEENIEMTLEEAKDLVVVTGNKAGFKMGSLQEFNLKFLLTSPKATAQEKAAAKIILAANND